MFTASVTRKLSARFFIAGGLITGACFAQNWEAGVGVGYGWYHNGSIISTGGTAAAGIRNRFVATGVVSDVGMRELFYVEELKRLWNLTTLQEQVLALYSAAMALDFLRRSSTSETPEWNARMLTAVERWMTVADSDEA